MFVDHIKVHAKAGDGGDGCVSFRREKFVPKGGPNGGDGGRGGDIILRADTHTDNLASFFYEPIIKAKDGENGSGKNLYGRAAKPKIVPVPIGTLVYRVSKAGAGAAADTDVDDATGAAPRRTATFYDLEKEPETASATLPAPTTAALGGGKGEDEKKNKGGQGIGVQMELIADLTRPGEEFVLCRGGEGGKGNVHFKSSTNRVPRQATPGGEGEESDFVFELRTIADAGLVGYPNAGKSTLLSRISAAKPKVASYPFTTLHPIIGVVEFPGFARATVADVPGLIEGAHRNVGLGHEFLRHLMRCRLLLFVLDMAGSEGRSPLDDLAKLREELKLYDTTLADKPWVVVANKMDLPEAAENLKAFKRRYRRREVLPISAETGHGLEELKTRLCELIAPVVV